ncbi:hypothetical protein ACN27F_16690 [Solwaraspora sp. WMMB335]|uniref:hypothetical protein n=1 Tax=Solwaraspora sp. WMMB335 TaxID=3404118 RepID=UPI003B955E0A
MSDQEHTGASVDHTADLTALRTRTGPFGMTYYVHAYAESDTRALVNALWVVRHSRVGDVPAVAVLATEILEFYGRRCLAMYGMVNAARVIDDARAAVSTATSPDGIESALAAVAAYVGELNFLIDQGIPPAALAEAFAAAGTGQRRDGE